MYPREWLILFSHEPSRAMRGRAFDFPDTLLPMKRLVVINKKIGETPLEALSAWKALHPLYAGVPASYAGRLDPMASGKLLVLLGDECKKKEQYAGLDKEYVVRVLLDVCTDTGDVLGLPTYAGKNTTPSKSLVRQVLESEVGSHPRAYPAYSSKTVAGVPLFLHALRGTPVELPTHTETIYSIHLEGMEQVYTNTLSTSIERSLLRVPRDSSPSKELGSDFRQDQIREAWSKLFTSLPDRPFTVLTIRVRCGTGTYMRTLAERIGSALETRALALSIHRTHIGKYRNLGLLSFFFPSF